jgi:hypothetical protein
MPLSAGPLKGRVFNPSDVSSLPSFVARMPEEARVAWCEAETARWRIVGTCSFCDRELVEGERIPHRMTHADPKVASAAMTAIQRGPVVARGVLELLREVLED